MSRKPNWSTVSARIQWIIDNCGMSANLLTEKCGYSNGYIGRLPRKLLNPKADVGYRLLEKLAEVAEVDFGWLSTGKGFPDERARRRYSDEVELLPPEDSGERIRSEHKRSDILPKSPFEEQSTPRSKGRQGGSRSRT